MHAVFLTFEFIGEGDRFTQSFRSVAERATAESGVVSSTWMNDGSTIGAFYVFKSSDAAEQYLNSPRLRALASHPSVYDFYIRHFSTLGSIGAALPASPSTLHSTEVVPGNACAMWQGGVDELIEHHPA